MTAPSAHPTSLRRPGFMTLRSRRFLPLALLGGAGLSAAGLQPVSAELSVALASPALALYGIFRVVEVRRAPLLTDSWAYLATDMALLAWLVQLSGGALSPFANLGYLWFFGVLRSLRPEQTRLVLLLAALPLTALAVGSWGESGWPLALGAHALCLGLAAWLGRTLLEERARHRSDPLTGTAGRRHGTEQLVARIAAGSPFSVAFLDLRDFKAINDRYGHGVGDEVLRQLAVRLRCAADPGDLVMRYGGDEFVVASSAPQLSERLQRALLQPVLTTAGEIPLEVDIGEAQWHSGETLASLLSRADAAMYQRKAAARLRLPQSEQLERH